MQKQKIILIGGFGGTGKTTIAAKLQESLDCSALIEADALFHIRPFEIGEQLGRIKLKNTLDVMRNFAHEKYEYIICEGLVWSQAELDAVTEAFPADLYEHFLFWFESEKQTRFKRVISRGQPGDTLEWLEHVEKKITNPWPLKISTGYSTAIDTTNKLPERIAKEILSIIQP